MDAKAAARQAARGKKTGAEKSALFSCPHVFACPRRGGAAFAGRQHEVKATLFNVTQSGSI
jgi:hypothetical protein